MYLNYISDYAGNCLITEISYKTKTKLGVKYYSKYVRFNDVSKLSEENLERINTCPQNLINGDNQNIIIQELINVIGQNNILVVWNEKQLVLLFDLIKQHGYKISKFPYIVLRNNMCSLCDNNYSMYTCMRMMNVVFEELQMDTLYSTMCLEHLFKLVFRLHYTLTKSYDKAFFCMMKRKQIKMNRRLLPRTYVQSKFSEELLDSLMGLYNLEYQVGVGVIFVRSRYSQWRILYDGEFIYELQHKSTQIANIYKGSQNKFGDEYHHQIAVCRSLHDVVQYIVNHDKNYLSKKCSGVYPHKSSHTPGKMNIFDL